MSLRAGAPTDDGPARVPRAESTYLESRCHYIENTPPNLMERNRLAATYSPKLTGSIMAGTARVPAFDEAHPLLSQGIRFWYINREIGEHKPCEFEVPSSCIQAMRLFTIYLWCSRVRYFFGHWNPFPYVDVGTRFDYSGALRMYFIYPTIFQQLKILNRFFSGY